MFKRRFDNPGLKLAENSQRLVEIPSQVDNPVVPRSGVVEQIGDKRDADFSTSMGGLLTGNPNHYEKGIKPKPTK